MTTTATADRLAEVDAQIVEALARPPKPPTAGRVAFRLDAVEDAAARLAEMLDAGGTLDAAQRARLGMLALGLSAAASIAVEVTP